MSDALSDPAMNFEMLVSRLRARAAVVQGKELASQYLTQAAQTRIIDKPHVKDIDARDVIIIIPANKERCRAREQFNDYQRIDSRCSTSDRTYHAFVMDFEKGYIIESDSEENNIEEEDNIEDDATVYFIINKLQDHSFIHWISGYHDDIDQEGFHHKLEVRELDQSERKDGLLEPTSQFVLEHHEGKIFQGILPDTGAAKVSTVGRRQLAALQRSYLEITVNRTRGDVWVLIIRKQGHPWFFLDKKQALVTFLTEIEIRRLHYWFGHPAVNYLHKLLKRAGHNDIDYNNLAEIEKFYHHC
ncbi:hypothetical protein TSTA_097850 [Talaromyces stipitatus ATCC 10500]|uniref:GAG-pre-integrase domain-containing protein n=1 Tax=Talaromyces stipitatus (strain ATCC 10500 / CBS 375.48 / QM 6759 / NRRL 1006) TaxID=441959 RepID=B8MM17_TALSN|nr:uncharacterized protein TSTA_097850 [Talaromyces stipitatus ATCC 10500]EED13529.1 hypothetical protein TSTA_097850 [Talaromyces stipitatus ATCC 10500]